MIIYNFFKHLILNIKYSKLLNKIYKEERILENLSEMFSVSFKKDWIGRVYAVLNPNLNNGKFESSTQVYEYNENGLDNSVYVEQWVMKNLNIASQFIKNNDLFDILTYSIKKLDDDENYLFIIQPITLEDCLKWSKRMGWMFCSLFIAGWLGLLIYHLITTY